MYKCMKTRQQYINNLQSLSSWIWSSVPAALVIGIVVSIVMVPLVAMMVSAIPSVVLLLPQIPIPLPGHPSLLPLLFPDVFVQLLFLDVLVVLASLQFAVSAAARAVQVRVHHAVVHLLLGLLGLLGHLSLFEAALGSLGGASGAVVGVAAAWVGGGTTGGPAKKNEINAAVLQGEKLDPGSQV